MGSPSDSQWYLYLDHESIEPLCEGCELDECECDDEENCE